MEYVDDVDFVDDDIDDEDVDGDIDDDDDEDYGVQSNVSLSFTYLTLLSI